MAGARPRLEAPLLDRLDGFLVESHTQRPGNVNVARVPLRINDQREHDPPLLPGFSAFVGVLRLGIVNRTRRGYRSTQTECLAADAAIRPRSDTTSISIAQAVSRPIA